MADMNLNTVDTRWTDDRIVELIRGLRNDLIKDFLDERILAAYWAEQYRIHSPSKIKIQLIRRDLKELLIAPVNVDHYRPIIEQIRETDSAGLAKTHEGLFYDELHQIFRKYLYSDIG